MGGTDQQATVPDWDNVSDEILCPLCGYDLRGTTGDRCSECGQTIDRAALRTSAFPWSRRREIGRVRAYIQTVWLVTIDSRRLRYEASKPQDMKDARKFRWITTSILAVAFVGIFTIFAAVEGGDPTRLAAPLWRTQSFMSPWNYLPPWLGDLLVPWAASLTIPLLVPALLVALAIHLTTSSRHLFRVREASPARQQCLSAIAQYSLAPIAWLLPPVLCAGLFLATLVPELNEGGRDHTGVILRALAALAILTLATHVVQRFRARRGGAEGSLALSLRLLKWILAITLLMVLFPLGRALAHMSLDDEAFLPPMMAALLVVGLAVLAALLRTVQWAVRVRHGDLVHGLLALLRLLGLWLIGLVVWLGLVPWCFGFLCIAFGFR